MIDKTMTGWFHWEIKPTHPGIYETGVSAKNGVHAVAYQHFNGEFWGLCGGCIEDADYGADQKSGCQQHHWRGLANKP